MPNASRTAGSAETTPRSAPPWLVPGVVLLCALAAFASVRQIQAPPAGAGEISLERALETERALTAQRRGTGTEGNAVARRELVRRLGDLGLEVEVQRSAMSDLEPNGPQRVLYMQNVVGRLAGNGSQEGALLLTAHYDSVADGPGAADDAAAVSALVEVMRILAAGPPLRHDVIVLFTDGEELGLVGARAFASRHRWADDVVAVLNFEARGVRGPSIMFETGRRSGALVDLYADVAPGPVASSLSQVVYEVMPNDTDFSVYRDRGLEGLNFAFIEGTAAYHHANDDLEHLSTASLLHHGATALAVVRALDAAPQALAAGGQRAYFDLPGLGLVVYPLGWSLVLGLVAALAALAALALAWRRFRPAGGAVLRGAVAGLAAVLVSLAAVVALEWLVSASFALGPILLADLGAWYVGWGLLAAGLAWWLFFLVLGRDLRDAGGAERASAAASAGMVPWLLLAVPTAFALPALAHLFTWPLLAAAVALALLVLGAGGSGRAAGVGTAAALGLLASALVLVLLWTPPAVLLPIALGPRSVAVVALVAGLAVCLLAPVLTLLPRPGGRRVLLPILLAAAGLVVTLVASATTGYSADRLRQTSLYHLQDADAGRAWVMTLDMPPEPWTARFVPADAGERPFPRFFEGTGAELASASGPTLPLPPPKVELIAVEPLDGDAPGGRRLHLRLASQRGAARLALLVRSPQPLAAMTFGGVPVDLTRAVDEGVGVGGDEPRARLRVDGAPAAGWEVTVDQAQPAPLAFDLVDWRWELPPGLADEPPPADLHTRLRSGVFTHVDVGALAAAAAAESPSPADAEELLTNPDPGA